jgi:hypothetical protein
MGALAWGIFELASQPNFRSGQVVVTAPATVPPSLSIRRSSPIAALRGVDTTVSDGFGSSVAMSGNFAVVGAPYHGAGRAYVFSTSAAGWKQIAELTGADTSGDDLFGSSVAISGSTVVVSAPGHDQSAGRIYVFTDPSAGWRQTAELVGSDTSANDRFGSSIAISGETVIASAPGYHNSTGTVYVFDQVGPGWRETAQLTGTDTVAGDGLGYLVALSGDTAAIGAPSHGYGAGKVAYGSIYLFAREGAVWKQDAELASSEQLTGRGQLGAAFAIFDRTLVATTAQQGGLAGRATLFTRTSNGWNRSFELNIPTVAYLSASSVALSGTTAVVGGAARDGAYAYKKTNGAWILTEQLYIADLPANPMPVSISSIATSGGQVLAGINNRVYVFDA